MIRLLIAAACIGIFYALKAFALAPPEVIVERNLQADLIFVGKVLSVHPNAETPHFLVKVEHVVKGIGHASKGATVSVLIEQVRKRGGLDSHTQGVLPVKVTSGALVVVYGEPSSKHPGHFKPLLEGLSVIILENE